MYVICSLRTSCSYSPFTFKVKLLRTIECDCTTVTHTRCHMCYSCTHTHALSAFEVEIRPHTQSHIHTSTSTQHTLTHTPIQLTSIRPMDISFSGLTAENSYVIYGLKRDRLASSGLYAALIIALVVVVVAL